MGGGWSYCGTMRRMNRAGGWLLAIRCCVGVGGKGPPLVVCEERLVLHRGLGW